MVGAAIPVADSVPRTTSSICPFFSLCCAPIRLHVFATLVMRILPSDCELTCPMAEMASAALNEMPPTVPLTTVDGAPPPQAATASEHAASIGFVTQRLLLTRTRQR